MGHAFFMVGVVTDYGKGDLDFIWPSYSFATVGAPLVKLTGENDAFSSFGIFQAMLC
ncbi:hypothetical protein [Psychrobacter arenosus]|uniref:hypothetical protein n=1 Tax=Psychrobacter arenosus TaxID=256326 RepID=UPI00191A4B44|nr:hypothetical protein [Psychrobacter arenosus]